MHYTRMIYTEAQQPKQRAEPNGKVSAAIMSHISVKFNFDPQELYQLAKFFLSLRYTCRACCHQKSIDQTQLASFKKNFFHYCYTACIMSHCINLSRCGKNKMYTIPLTL